MIIFDGIIYNLQKNGGISVYFDELFKLLNQKNIKYKTILYNEELTDKYNSTFLQPRILERYRNCKLDQYSEIFHSTYYREPHTKNNHATVVTVHDFLYEKYSRFDKKLIHGLQKNSAIKNADAIICVSKKTKKDLLDYIGITNNQKIFVIHNGVSSMFKTSEKSKTSKPYILYIGNRRGYKNFSLLKKTIPMLKEYDLKIVGGEPLTSNDYELNSACKHSSIEWFGNIDEKTLIKLYQDAYCLVYPSLDEGFGIPIIESMKCGTPVICMNNEIFQEVAGKAAIFIENDVDSLLEGLKKLSESYEQYKKRIYAHSQQFSWEKTHSKTLEVYDYLRN